MCDYSHELIEFLYQWKVDRISYGWIFSNRVSSFPAICPYFHAPFIRLPSLLYVLLDVTTLILEPVYDWRARRDLNKNSFDPKSELGCVIENNASPEGLGRKTFRIETRWINESDENWGSAILYVST